MRPEALLDGLEENAQTAVLARWCTSREGWARRAMTIAKAWVRSGRTVRGRYTPAVNGHERSDRQGALSRAVVERLAAHELDDAARCHGLEALGRFGATSAGLQGTTASISGPDQLELF